MDKTSAGAPAGILRRLAALTYDALLVTALLFVATFALLPLTGGEAITPATQGAGAYAYRAWLLAVAFGYFGRSWTRGRTLGLRAWHLHIESPMGAAPGWAAALLRFGIGVVLGCMSGIGAWLLARPTWPVRAGGAALLLPLVVNYLWIRLDGQGRSLQDRLCRMRLRRD